MSQALLPFEGSEKAEESADQQPKNYRNSKGKQLEKAFAEWMCKELGFDKTQLNEPAMGQSSQRAYDVDIHAVKQKYKNYAKEKALGATALASGGLLLYDMAAGATLFVFTLGIYYVAKKWFEQTLHAWVECKNHAATVKRRDVQKLIQAVDDVRGLGDSARWKPDFVYLVSGTDFDTDALNCAADADIICYRWVGEGKFEQVKALS